MRIHFYFHRGMSKNIRMLQEVSLSVPVVSHYLFTYVETYILVQKNLMQTIILGLKNIKHSQTRHLGKWIINMVVVVRFIRLITALTENKVYYYKFLEFFREVPDPLAPVWVQKIHHETWNYWASILVPSAAQPNQNQRFPIIWKVTVKSNVEFGAVFLQNEISNSNYFLRFKTEKNTVWTWKTLRKCEGTTINPKITL